MKNAIIYHIFTILALSVTKIAHFHSDKSAVIIGIYTMAMTHARQGEENVTFDPNKLTEIQKWESITRIESRTKLQDGTSTVAMAQ